MPRLHSSKTIIKTLEKKGFVIVSQKGSHIKMRKKGKPTLTTIVPVERKQIPIGTFKSILRQSNLIEKDF
jgi:predicted RNA binding protein YcfA (HicA-like mRNA interferase family)